MATHDDETLGNIVTSAILEKLEQNGHKDAVMAEMDQDTQDVVNSGDMLGLLARRR